MHNHAHNHGSGGHHPHASGRDDKATQPATAGTKYTCTMHPEIVRDAPGDCPICGMALVPIAGTGEGDDTDLRDLTRRFWIGAALSLLLVMLAMAPMVGFQEPFGLARAPVVSSSSRSEHQSCCGLAGRSCASSGSRSLTARSTCTR
jgi:P-type Cu+ transporter